MMSALQARAGQHSMRGQGTRHRDAESALKLEAVTPKSDRQKIAATYIHNLTTVLADTVSNPPGSLSYSIPNEPAS